MSTKRKILTINDPETPAILSRLQTKTDFKGSRIKQLLALPDLARIENSPLKFLVDAVVKMRRFDDFDIIDVPEIVSVRNNFDLLNTAPDHPSRRETDTYYAEKNYVLRTQTTVMWPYYLSEENIKKLETEGEIGALCYGKVYRKDEIDRSHYPVFHQIDGLYICRKNIKIIGIKELTEVLVDIAKNIYGAEVEYKISEDTFPFTDPSIQIAIKWGDQWLEVVGAGAVHKQVLKNLGLDQSVYNGWAFGFGLERLAMIKMEIPDIRIFWSTDERITSQFKDLNSRFREISKYPMTYRDISFVVGKDTSLNNYYEIIRDCAGDLVEEVSLLDKYENKEKFGENNVSYTFRIIYRSPERTLTNEEIDEKMLKIASTLQNQYQAKIR